MFIFKSCYALFVSCMHLKTEADFTRKNFLKTFLILNNMFLNKCYMFSMKFNLVCRYFFY